MRLIRMMLPKRPPKTRDPPPSMPSFFIFQGILSLFLCSTVIGRFWNNPKNRDVVDAFMNNKLCVDAARGEPEAIAAYKKYAVVSSTIRTH